ncbi:hypothetical protein GOEFS_121_00040 [Gordonia effusa NBRC 100432]|uniref:Uncharacterized protein n=1 Tax=Gordonia effusa NBRC 100432 TaxID=1077974 RepID=H0R6A1_9ACTN|nr:hypothetical protein [Gordonia effusa]GAB20602.1 hypothetical protein GOEFS_121_00040 [Gordonia effusa NBRC 100432]
MADLVSRVLLAPPTALPFFIEFIQGSGIFAAIGHSVSEIFPGRLQYVIANFHFIKYSVPFACELVIYRSYGCIIERVAHFVCERARKIIWVSIQTIGVDYYRLA